MKKLLIVSKEDITIKLNSEELYALLSVHFGNDFVLHWVTDVEVLNDTVFKSPDYKAVISMYSAESDITKDIVGKVKHIPVYATSYGLVPVRFERIEMYKYMPVSIAKM